MKKRKHFEESSTLRVILEADIRSNPECDHGPSVLFERVFSNKKMKTQFFACSAFRDRKQCPFYLLSNSKSDKSRPCVRKKSKYRPLRLINNPKAFCSTCQILLDDRESHNNSHELTTDSLKKPSKLLTALDNSKSQAQFHFSQESVEVITKNVKNLDPSLVICIGTPSIFEELNKDCCDNFEVILLDIDHRLAMFHNKFCHYNMFNHHFFDQEGLALYQQQLGKHEKVVVITDPPFGGKPELIANTLRLIKNDFGIKDNHCEKSQVTKYYPDLSVFWIFPYYMEPQITKFGFQMSDYQVSYNEEGRYRQGHQNANRRKLGSPVRIYTTVPLNRIDLSHLKDDYRLCQSCDKYVVLTNRHCHECGTCTGKNGGLYKHCYKCERCVKHSWRHCEICNRCTLPDHDQCRSADVVK